MDGIKDASPQGMEYRQAQNAKLPKIDDSESNILVAIKIRPLNQKEESAGDKDIIRIEDNLMIVLDPVEIEFANENKKMLDVYHRSKEQQYSFDKIFRLHSQEEVAFILRMISYQEFILHAGYNATVFAYGPTGTGKTYTMLGYSDIPGLCSLTIQDIFQSIRKDYENDYTVTITYVEIYNETIRDLLIPNSSYLELRDDPLKGITIAGVTEFKAESTEQVEKQFQWNKINDIFIKRRRTTESTNANQTSSRSHAVFQVMVSSSSRTKNTEQENLQGKLSLIDLAGSERGNVTENRGIRLREGAKINQSLLALANCINALGDKAKKGFFVPYRDSKLTRMLKDSLGGNCRTVMIANVSPSGSQFEETINTLKYASRAKNIKTKVSANKRLVSMHIAEYKNIINDLRSEIEQLKAKLHDKIGDSNDILALNEEEAQYLEKPHLQYQQEKPIANCVCGRQEDEMSMRRIQEDIFENFQNRIQLRRGLMEIEEQNAMNQLEIKKKQAEILIWKKEHSKLEQNHSQNDLDFIQESKQDLTEVKKKLPEEVKLAIKAVRTLKVSTEKNSLRKEMMTLSLIENIANAKVIRDQIPKKIKLQEKRNFLELVIKNHVLELQNIEMEINLQIQEKTIQDLKNIIDAQKRIILENNMQQYNNNNQEEDNNNSFISANNFDIQFQDFIEDEDYDEDIDKDILEGEDEDLEAINDLIEKQKEQHIQSPFKKDINSVDEQKLIDKLKRKEDERPKRWSSKPDPLPEINQVSNKRDRSAAAANQGSRAQQKVSESRSLANEYYNDYDDNQSEITVTNGNTPKVAPIGGFREKKKDHGEARKKNTSKPPVSASQKKKEVISASAVNQINAQPLKEKEVIQSIQGYKDLSQSQGAEKNPQGMPPIQIKQNIIQKEQIPPSAKGKNIILPSLNQVNSPSPNFLVNQSSNLQNLVKDQVNPQVKKKK